MINIGKLYLQREQEQVRLCADITWGKRGTTLWFGVAPEQEEYLCVQRSDAFVMALLPTAMREGQDISCETPMSQRLHYQLEHYLVPTLVSAGTLYHRISIHAPLTSERLQNKGAVGTAFSGGVDSLYTIMSHGADSDYPVTHLTHFNVGVFAGFGGREAFLRSCEASRPFADELGLEFVALDSNLQEAIPERYLDVYSFRNLAGALALQGLLSVYLLSAAIVAENFIIDLHDSCGFDLLNVPCAQTESLAIHLAGMEITRIGKLEALTQWEPSHRWLHPCTAGLVNDKNCGGCQKCIRDLVALYALDKLDCYDQMFDIPAFRKTLPQRIGYVLANTKSVLTHSVACLLKERGAYIPPAAYVFEKQFRRSMENLEKQIEENE